MLVVIHDAPKSDTAATAAALMELLLTRVIQVHGLQQVGRRLRHVISIWKRNKDIDDANCQLFYRYMYQSIISVVSGPVQCP